MTSKNTRNSKKATTQGRPAKKPMTPEEVERAWKRFVSACRIIVNTPRKTLKEILKKVPVPRDARER